MATFTKRQGKRGTRWTVRVRLAGRHETKTFSTKAAGESWARAKEGAIETGVFQPAQPGIGAIFADKITAFLEYRQHTRRPPGRTFANALSRFERDYGLEPVSTLTAHFWLRYATGRLAKGVRGSTVAGELAYATSVLRHAARDDKSIDDRAASKARAELAQDGVEVKSRERKKRLSDAEIDALLGWIDANAERTSLPMRDLVEFALATAMRRNEILSLKWSDIDGRIARIRRKHPRERDRFEDVPLLKPHAEWPRVDPLAVIERQPKQGETIFPYLGDTLAFWFERACEGAGLTGVVFHLLRHECLSRLADRGFDPLRLAMVGGHRDLRNVKRYAKLDPVRLAHEG